MLSGFNSHGIAPFKARRQQIKHLLRTQKSRHKKYQSTDKWFSINHSDTEYVSEYSKAQNNLTLSLAQHDSIGISQSRLDWESLNRTIKDNLRSNKDKSKTVLVSSNCSVTRYLDSIPYEKLMYFCEGAKPAINQYCFDSIEAETQLIQASDIVVITEKQFYPGGIYNKKTHYIPKGVHVDNFSSIPCEPPREKILGFFGDINHTLDFNLIELVAKALPNWQLHLIGKNDVSDNLNDYPLPTNVKILPAVPFRDLSQHIINWSAAWIPVKKKYLHQDQDFHLSTKLKEYLAAGFPSQAPPLDELEQFSSVAALTLDPDEIVHWLLTAYKEDSSQERQKRKNTVISQSWINRAKLFRSWVND